MRQKINSCSKLIGKICVSKENGKQLVVNNPENKKAFCVQVDGCVFTDNRLKCDYLYEVFEGLIISKVIYLELKGSSFDHGVKQIEATINDLKHVHSGVSDKTALLIGRQLPSMFTGMQKLKDTFKSKYAIVFTAKTNQHTIVI